MIEIRFKGNYEVANIAGHTIAEARDLYKSELGIADKAAAVLNGKKLKSAAEAAAVLNDNDNLEFKTARGNKVMYLVGALLLAMAITGGVFAFGFTNASTTINAVIANADFASVTANTSSAPSWTVHGLQKNSTGSGTLFDIDTITSGYTGDFVATISLANVSDLATVYRNLSLAIEIRGSADNLIDINSDNISNSNDFTLLTLENSKVTLDIKQNTPDVYTVKLKNGYYICNIGTTGWDTGAGTPELYCELAQR
jgi:hypothetical protein